MTAAQEIWTTSEVVWLLVGTNLPTLFLGYLFGRLIKATIRIEETMTTDGQPVQPETEPTGDQPAGNVKAEARQLSFRAAMVAVVVMVVIGVGTIVTGVTVARRQAEAEARDDRLTACITGYSNALADAFRSRAAATNEANEAVDRVFSAIGMAFSDAPIVGRDRVLKAIQEYNDTRAEAKKTQTANPLPDAPRDACAELMEE